MKWRLEEGKGEAIYKIGVEDNGTCAGLSDSELECTMNTLRKMAERLMLYTSFFKSVLLLNLNQLIVKVSYNVECQMLNPPKFYVKPYKTSMLIKK